MGRFTTSFKYTNDDTISDQIKEYRKKLEEDAKKKGAIGTVADGDIRITAKLKKSDNGGITTTDNPLIDFSLKDAFKLNDNGKNHYLRFGALLEFIVHNIIPTTTDSRSTPMFKIDTEPWYNYMYSLPNQISLDPRVCLVRNSQFNTEKGNIKILNEIPYFFKEIDNGVSTNENSAYPLNIYLNFNFILECLKSDEKGNVSVYELISNICTGLNRALGGINNLEPIIDETDNTLRIIDTTPIPGHSAEANFSEYKLQIYGYDKIANDYISNFVRKVDLKTAITPEYATMITVGATAGGYVKGTEATAFSKWNTGLVDRFKEEFTPPQATSNDKSDPDEAAANYKETFQVNGYANRYGLTYFGTNRKFSDNIIEKNLSIVTEYYKWLIAKNSEGEDKLSGGTVGFIPFKLGLTLDGISGIKIYNVLRINTEFLPKAYGKTVDLIVTGVSHRLNDNDWETSIEATVMPKTGEMALVTITAKDAEEKINSALNSPTVKGKVPESKKNIVTKIVELAKKNGITDRERLTCILAVAGGETQWDPGKSESFSYSLSRAREVFGSRIPNNKDTALKYIPKEKGGSGSQEKLANLLYGGRYDNSSNEGWKYRGRGMTQITFKGNYTNVQNKLVSKFFPNKGNIVTNPDLVNDTDVSVAILVYGKLQGFFGDKLVKNDKAYLSDPVRVQATQNGSNGIGKRRSNSVTKNYANAIYAVNNTPWVQELIS